MLVGTKCDETEGREVPTTEGSALAKKWTCGFMETSAKTNVNVKETFQELLQLEKRRNMTLVGDKKSKMGKQSKDRLKQGKCSLM